MGKTLFKATVFVVILSLVFVHSAWAGPYIDPNTGGMIFQILAVSFGLLSGLVLVFYGRIKMLYARFARYLREKRNVQEEAPTKE